MRAGLLVVLAVLLFGPAAACAQGAPTVAAASDLQAALPQVAEAFQR